MVSRRKILSRSRDDLTSSAAPELVIEEEDVWYTKDKLVKDHLSEVLTKWSQIDDEIWAKVIVLERNRRVAKAYARAPVLTVNGSDDGFDGFRIGLNGFSNPMRDSKTEDILRHIGHGIKLKMDEEGNILVKRISRNGVYVKGLGEEGARMALDVEKPVKLFDMKQFTARITRELRRAYPDRRKLETECIISVAFVKQEADLLQTPCWIMIINLVAMDMLKTKLPPVKSPPAPLVKDIKNRPRIPIPDEEDGYSLLPPKLPPRDGLSIPKPDYDVDQQPPPDPEPKLKANFFGRGKGSKQQEKEAKPAKKDRKYDDPYYCGLRARIPAFVQRMALPPRNQQRPAEALYGCQGSYPQQLYQQQQQQRYGRSNPVAAMWHAKSVDSGMASIHSNPYADPMSIRRQQPADKYSWSNFESATEREESEWENYWQSS